MHLGFLLLISGSDWRACGGVNHVHQGRRKAGDPGNGHQADEEDEFATPLGLRIGAAVDVDTLPLRMHSHELHVKLPEETLIIVAQGYVDLGDSTYAHRYYTADNTMIQALTVAGMEDEHVEELTLYVPYQSY